MSDTNTVFFWVIPALLVFFALLYPVISRILLYFKQLRKGEDERRQAEIQRQIVTDQQLEALRGRRFIVYVRQRDGRKSSFEAILIKYLLECNVIVPQITEHVGKNLAEGYADSLEDDCAIIGSAWYVQEACEIGCDYRILRNNGATNEPGEKFAKIQIVGAGVQKWRSDCEDILARSIIRDIADQLWRRRVSE